MWDYIVAIIMGIVEGITEFLPISSTGHLILTGELLGFTGDNAKNFEVVIQLGAILAVAILYFKKLFSMISPNKILHPNPEELNVWHIFVGIVPTMAIAFLLHDYIKEYLFSPFTVIIGLVLGSIMLIWSEMSSKKTAVENIDKISYRQAFYIGLAQCLSLWPGFSRSGATISGGLFFGLNRKTAAEFSFILAVPIMFAASAYDILKMLDIFTKDYMLILSVGFVVSFLVAYAAVVSFLKLLNKYTLKSFAYYRLIIAAIALLYFYVLR